MSQYIVSARKYRPDSFETLIGQDNIARTLKNSIQRGQLAHAYLFCGPRGVGKTTTARIFAKMINCSNPGPDLEPCGECESCVSFREGRSYCIHELDAASNNGVDDIRALMDKVQIPPQVGRYSVYIIDEVHMLSSQAFNAFLKTLEEPPAHAIFILATTEKHKVIPTILSRCQTYDFNRISVRDIVANLRTIAEKESVTVDDESLHIIAQKADGAMRDALTIFDQTVAFCGSDIHSADVMRNLNVLDYEYSFSLVDAFRSQDYAKSLLIFDEVLSKGFNAQHFVGALSNHLRDLIVSRTAGLESLLELPESLRQRYAAQAAQCTLQFLYDALAVTTQCEAGYKASSNQRLHVEFALMKLSFLLRGVPQTVVSVPASNAPQTTAAAAPSATAAVSSAPAAAPRTTVSAPVVPAAASSAYTAQRESRPSPVAQPQTASSASASQRESSPVPQKPDPAPAVQQPEEKPDPAPRRRVVKTGASLSINSLMKKEEEKAAPMAVEMPDTKASLPSDEEISAKWKSLAGEYPSSPRLANTIANANLEIAEEDGKKVVTFVVVNESQRKWIVSNKLRELEGKLQAALKCPAVKLLVEARQFEEEKVIYTPEDKAKALMEAEPEVIDLIKDFSLDVK